MLKETSNENNEFSLNDKQVLQLAKVGVYIEDVFGNHRDIEWAFFNVSLLSVPIFFCNEKIFAG